LFNSEGRSEAELINYVACYLDDDAMSCSFRRYDTLCSVLLHLKVSVIERGDPDVSVKTSGRCRLPYTVREAGPLVASWGYLLCPPPLMSTVGRHQ
jgi:hypothetical protein